MWTDRIFCWLDGDEPGTESAKIRAYQRIFALIVCTEYWTKAIYHWAELEIEDAIMLVLATLLAATVVHGRRRRAAFAGLAVLQAWYISIYFPMTGNHRYLELFIATLFAVLDDGKKEERRLILRSLRWVVVVVLFYSGLQKLLHGYYFRGQFLSYSLWRDGFLAALGPLLPPGEFERLTSYAAAVGDGPYLVSSPAFLVVSNSVWLTEIALALCLFAPATRRYAWILGCAFVIATEAVAREFLFGVEFACAIVLFARRDLVGWLVWPVTVFLALLVLMRLGVVPEVVFN